MTTSDAHPLPGVTPLPFRGTCNSVDCMDRLASAAGLEREEQHPGAPVVLLLSKTMQRLTERATPPATLEAAPPPTISEACLHSAALISGPRTSIPLSADLGTRGSTQERKGAPTKSTGAEGSPGTAAARPIGGRSPVRLAPRAVISSIP